MNITRKISLIVVVSVALVTLPSLWFYYQNAKQSLLRTEVEKLSTQMQKTIDYDETFLQLTTPFLTALSQQLTEELNQAVTSDVNSLFAHKLMQYEDGAWRNRKQNFNGRQQAGLFLPPDISLTDQDKQFYLSALAILEVFGASTSSNPVFDNVWMLGHDRSELIFSLSYPDFIYSMAVDTDYTKTPWMTLASPEENPERSIKWTPALFDPVTQSWIVSAVYPLYIKDKWHATLGMDINVDKLIDLLHLQNEAYLGEQHFLLTADGKFVLAGQWQALLENNPETFKLNSKDQHIQKMLNEHLSSPATSLQAVTIAGKGYQVIASLIEPMAWRYFRLVPTNQILQPLQKQVLRTSSLIFLTAMLLAMFIYIAVRKLMVRPLLVMAERARAYASGRELPVNNIDSRDEIGDLHHALQSLYDELTVEKQQLLDSKHSYRRVITHIREVIVQIDGAGTWRFLSPVWKKMTGYGLKQSLNKPVKDFIHPAEQHLVEQMLKVFKSSTINTWLGEVRLLTTEQGYVWVNMSLQRSVDNQVPGEMSIVGTIENIQNERLERAVNDTLRIADKMVLKADSQLSTLLDFVCKEMARVLGVSLFWIKLSKGENVQLFHGGEQAPFLFDARGIWSGLSEIDEILHPLLDKQALLRLKNIDEQPSSWRERLSNDELNDGILLPFNLADSTKCIIGVHSEYPDVCNEVFQTIMYSFASSLDLLCKLAEDQQLMRLHRVAVENTANTIMITDAEGYIEWVNDAFVRLTLYEFDDVIGLTPRVLKGKGHVQGHAEDIWQTISTGKVWQGEREICRKDGSNLYVYQTITPLLNNLSDITHFITVIENITERKSNQERIAFMATHDDLTKLPNRNLLHDSLERAISASALSMTKMAVLFIDIDHFKYINDSLGHQIGDELLQVVADRFTKSLRKGDTVARFGGDEFVIVLPEIAYVKNINDIVRNLLKSVQVPYNISGHELMVTGSIGISVYPDDSEDADDLIQHADSAMYLAKQLGRNNSQFYTAEINEKMTRRLTLEKALRQALEQDEFVVFYQPKINLTTHKMTGMEALVRWQHPELGLVSPIEFIPLAEETGIILALGEWVMMTACRQMYEWEQLFPDLINMSINVSARQFWQRDYTELVASILSESQVSADKIELELTESVVMNDIESAIDTMSALKKLDVSLSIDDFGTGYSSLSYLQRFPVDVLKIDRCFVTDLQNENADSAIVRSILSLAENFKLKVVAEGIENLSQQRALIDLGCDYGQGYFYSRPVDAVSMEVLLSSDKETKGYFNRE